MRDEGKIAAGCYFVLAAQHPSVVNWHLEGETSALFSWNYNEKGTCVKVEHRSLLKRALIRLAGGHPLNSLHSLRRWEGALFRQVFLSAGVGIATGFLIAAVDYLVRDQAVWFLYDLSAPIAIFLLPLAAIVMARLCIRYFVPGREGELTEDYIFVFHGPNRSMREGNLPGKLLASLITIAGGGALGLEGPAVYLGANLGDSFQKRGGQLFKGEHPKSLLVAGAAAGMAALFKAPLTGVIFALEVPYLNGLAGFALVPALVASTFGYLTFAAMVGSEPLFRVVPPKGFDLGDVFLAVVLGLLCALGARLFAACLHGATSLRDRLPAWASTSIGGLGVGAIAVAVFSCFGKPMTFGPGYKLIQDVMDNRMALPGLAILFAARFAATILTVEGGGIGGLFFPQAVMGFLLGSIAARFAPGATTGLLPLVGLAAFVGAGYRVPLAAVAFVAETTGTAWAFIPAAIASVTAFLAMGGRGISKQQRPF
jgi:CIC family chloride channel protein